MPKNNPEGYLKKPKAVPKENMPVPTPGHKRKSKAQTELEKRLEERRRKARKSSTGKPRA